MITYTNFNPDGMPLDENGKVIDIIEGRPRFFNGTEVIEFDSNEERDNYLTQLYGETENTEG
jgi:hypothetical protein